MLEYTSAMNVERIYEKYWKNFPVFKETRQIRDDNFPPRIFFSFPGLCSYRTSEAGTLSKPVFVAVSVTGGECELNCLHCQGKLLQKMPAVVSPPDLYRFAERFAGTGGQGILITGGCDRNGRIPYSGYWEVIRSIKENLALKIAMHTGLVDRETAARIKRAGVDLVMTDVIGDRATINDIYRLKAGVDDFEETLKLLRNTGIRFVPHVLIGLDRGRIKGEYRALQMIARYRPSALVMIIFRPLTGTALENETPPAYHELASIFCYTRKNFPRSLLLLGCARPFRQYRVHSDILALLAGFNGIAFPAEGILQLAKKQGLVPEISYECCSFTPATVSPTRSISASSSCF